MGRQEVGLIVDDTNDVMNIPANKIEPQPDVISGEKQDFISGVLDYNNRFLIILKLENIINMQEDRRFDGQ